METSDRLLMAHSTGSMGWTVAAINTTDVLSILCWANALLSYFMVFFYLRYSYREWKRRG